MVLTLISPQPSHQLRNPNTHIHRKKTLMIKICCAYLNYLMYDSMVGVMCTHRAFLHRVGKDALLQKNKHIHKSSADIPR